MKRSTTETLIDSLRILADDIVSDDGVAGAAIREAAERLEEMQAELTSHQKGPPMEYPLKHGQALVLVGPQGSGKSALARQIAAQHGTYAEICADDLFSKFGLGDAMANEPDTLIVAEVPAHKLAGATLKAILDEPLIACHQKYKPTRMVKTPRVIVCCTDGNVPVFAADERRLRVTWVGMTDPATVSEAELMQRTGLTQRAAQVSVAQRVQLA